MVTNIHTTINRLKFATATRGLGSATPISAYGYSEDFSYDKQGNINYFQRKTGNSVVDYFSYHQIKNLYDAGGQKLRSDYFTQLVALSAPLTEGQALQQNYIANAVDQNGTLYVGNKEYKFTGNQSGAYTLNQVHNPEGYVYFQGSPMYNYFRRDHLGNIREVWQANMNLTVQRTNYYPSGLPWNSATGSGAGVQNKKYNGKEFVEMHGLDEYDSEARWYYPAIMRTTTMDPHSESYYDTSPYAWCGNNFVNAIDLDGRDWYSYVEKYKDKDGKEQTRTSYKYVEGKMSNKEMKEGGYTHLGLTYTNGNDYYSLFGSTKDLKTKEGQAYQKIDNAIIEFSEYKEMSMKDPAYDNNGYGYPSTNFSMNNNNDFNVQYENSAWGVVRLSKSESNNAYMEDWIGNPDQPKIISGWTGNNIKYYHILLRSKRGDRNRDIVHLKYNQANAMKLLKTYYNLFPKLKPKSK